jgi:hypothetical protein
MSRQVMETTIVKARGSIKAGVVGCNLASCVELVRGESVCGKACCVLASNHTRAGTVPDRRGRCGMNYVTAGQCWACRGELWPVNAGFSTKLVQARGRINAGGLVCIKASSGGFCFGEL